MRKFNAFITAIGTLLLGLAACWASYQTHDVLGKILEIKAAIAELKQSNKILQDSNNNIKMSIETLNYQLIANKSEEIIKLDENEALKTLQQSDNNSVGNIYLPTDKFKDAKQLLESKNNILLKQFLNKNLKIWRSDENAVKK